MKKYEPAPDDEMFDDKDLEHDGKELVNDDTPPEDEPLELTDDDMEQLWGDAGDEEEEEDEE